MKHNKFLILQQGLMCASLICMLLAKTAFLPTISACMAKPDNRLVAENDATAETTNGLIGISFFTGNWQQAVKTAEQLQRPVFVLLNNFSVTEFRQQEETLFNIKEVELFFNTHFFNCKINPNSEDGRQLCNKYQINEFPVWLFVTHTGEVLLQESGLKNKDELMTAGQKAIAKYEEYKKDATIFKTIANPNKPNQSKLSREYIQLLEYQIQYKNGCNAPDFLYEYAYLLKKFNEPWQNVVNQFIAGIPPTDLALPRNIFFIYDFADDIQSTAFSLLLTNRFYYTALLDKQSINQRITDAFKVAVFEAAANKSNAQLNAVLSVLRKSGLNNDAELEWYLKALFFEKSGNWSDYSGLIIGQYKNGNGIEPELLDEAAWKFAIHVENELKVEKALLWAQQNMQQQPYNFKYIETYAALLYRLHKPAKALKEAQRAIEIARKEGDNYLSTLTLVELMQKEMPLTDDIRQ